MFKYFSTSFKRQSLSVFRIIATLTGPSENSRQQAFRVGLKFTPLIIFITQSGVGWGRCWWGWMVDHGPALIRGIETEMCLFTPGQIITHFMATQIVQIMLNHQTLFTMISFFIEFYKPWSKQFTLCYSLISSHDASY